jgi:hypothetical protein
MMMLSNNSWVPNCSDVGFLTLSKIQTRTY